MSDRTDKLAREARRDALLQAYRATRVVVALPEGDIVLAAADEPAAPLPAALRPRAWILTAWNPWSQEATPAENERRSHALQAELRALPVSFWPALGRARNGEWEERSFAVVGLTAAAALALGRRFEQNAIFEVTEDGLRVRCCLE